MIIQKQGLKKGELKVSEFGVDRFKVEEALEYLKENNFYYENIRIHKDTLRELENFDPTTHLKDLVLEKGIREKEYENTKTTRTTRKNKNKTKTKQRKYRY